MFIYLTPFIPLSMIWICILIMRGNGYIREAKPLSTLHSPFPYKGRGLGG